jgi:hypothetical protein
MSYSGTLSIAQLTHLHEMPLQAVPRLVKKRLLVMLVEGNLHIRLTHVDNKQFTMFALCLINQVYALVFG